MLLKNFRSYGLAVELYRALSEICRGGRIPAHLKDQILRAGSSIALNLSEGSARPTEKDRKRFYGMAFSSLREVQAVLDLENGFERVRPLADQLGGCLYNLTRK